MSTDGARPGQNPTPARPAWSCRPANGDSRGHSPRAQCQRGSPRTPMSSEQCAGRLTHVRPFWRVVVVVTCSLLCGMAALVVSDIVLARLAVDSLTSSQLYAACSGAARVLPPVTGRTASNGHGLVIWSDTSPCFRTVSWRWTAPWFASFGLVAGAVASLIVLRGRKEPPSGTPEVPVLPSTI